LLTSGVGGSGFGGLPGQRLVWCFPLHVWQRNLDWHAADLWWPKQLKQSLCSFTIAHRFALSLMVVHSLDEWGFLQ
jgi:hypothetical protein